MLLKKDTKRLAKVALHNISTTERSKTQTNRSDMFSAPWTAAQHRFNVCRVIAQVTTEYGIEDTVK